MRTLLGLLLLTIIGCDEPGKPYYIDIDPQVVPYHTRFMQYVHDRHTPIVHTSLVIRIVKARLPLNHIGQCDYGDEYLPNRIMIDQDYWNWASDLDREQLIFHELGHCLLNRPHNDRMVIKNLQLIPASIMATGHFGQNIYLRYRYMYLDELFGKVPNTVVHILEK